MINYEKIWILICILLLISTLLLLTYNNPIYKILSLILIFGLAAFLFIILDYFFIGLTYFIVYIGAIIILFLFVIMISPQVKTEPQSLNFFYILIPSALFFFSSFCFPDDINIYNYFYTIWSQDYYTLTDIELIGYLIYISYPLTIILLSLLLWLILIGILCLTI